jgi:hypothetical protein
MNQRDHRMVGALVNFSGAMDANTTIADGCLLIRLCHAGRS